jgi:hypothetical protein
MQAGTGSSAGDTRPEEAFVYSRRPGVGLFLALVLVLTVAVPVSAKPRETTRVVHFGSAVDGTLTVTPNVVFPGGYVDFTAVARNDGPQTLTHATFGLGNQAALPGPGGPSLPAGWTIEAITPSVGSCTWDSAGAMCDLGSLVGRGGQATVYVLLKTSITPASGVWASLKIAEQVNDQGANTDTFYATSNVSAAAACNQIAESKVPGNTPVGLEYCSDDQESAVNVVTSAFGAGSLEHKKNGFVCSPGGGAVCFGDYVAVSVSNESTVTWTFTWDVSLLPKNFKLSRLAIMHHTDAGATVRIAADDVCDSATDVECTIAGSVVLDATTLTMQIRTLENGFGKGAG